MTRLRLGGGLAERNPELDSGARAGAAFDSAPSPGEFGAFPDEELALEERKAAEQLFRLRFQMKLGQTEGVKKLHELKKDVARINTIERERELGIHTTVASKHAAHAEIAEEHEARTPAKQVKQKAVKPAKAKKKAVKSAAPAHKSSGRTAAARKSAAKPSASKKQASRSTSVKKG